MMSVFNVCLYNSNSDFFFPSYLQLCIVYLCIVESLCTYICFQLLFMEYDGRLNLDIFWRHTECQTRCFIRFEHISIIVLEVNVDINITIIMLVFSYSYIFTCRYLMPYMLFKWDYLATNIKLMTTPNKGNFWMI